jgi:hypothetical protein
MSNADPIPEFKKWRDLVGGFILAFGDIELVTYRLWKELRPSTKAPQKFKPRANGVVESLRATDGGNDRQSLIKCLEEAIILADKRNTIAHSPMQLQIYEHTISGKLISELAIASETNDDYIDDAHMVELESQATELVARLYMELGMIPAKRHAGVADPLDRF